MTIVQIEDSFHMYNAGCPNSKLGETNMVKIILFINFLIHSFIDIIFIFNINYLFYFFHLKCIFTM